MLLDLLQLEMMEEDLLFQGIAEIVSLKRRLLSGSRKRKHRYWVHDIVKRRFEKGAYHNLTQELALDPERFQGYFRMSPYELEEILGHVGPTITRRHVAREAIDPRQRLAICIR